NRFRRSLVLKTKVSLRFHHYSYTLSTKCFRLQILRNQKLLSLNIGFVKIFLLLLDFQYSNEWDCRYYFAGKRGIQRVFSNFFGQHLVLVIQLEDFSEHDYLFVVLDLKTPIRLIDHLLEFFPV